MTKRKRLENGTLLAMAIALLAVPLVRMPVSSAHDARDTTLSNNVVSQRVFIRHHAGGTLRLSDYATVTVPRDSLDADATIHADLDLDNNRLIIGTEEDVPLSGKVNVELNFARLPQGLTVEFANPEEGVTGSRTSLSGTLTGVDLVRHEITVKDFDNDLHTLRMEDSARITRQEIGKEVRYVSLGDLALGDEVDLALDRDDGMVTSLEATYRVVSGTIRSLSGRRIRLTTNTLYDVAWNAPITDARGRDIAMSDLRVGQRVNMRLNPTTQEVCEVSLGALRARVTASGSQYGSAAPSILSPTEGEEVGKTIKVRGRTEPYAKVTIEISYKRSGLFGGEGDLTPVTVTTDARGDFESQIINLKSPGFLEDRVEHTIRVTAIRTDGARSEEAVLKVYRR